MKKLDKLNMRQVILDLPKQFQIEMKSIKGLKLKVKKISNIIICGMGGSALPGNILKAANYQLSLTKNPIFIHRNYGLPKETTRQSLIICVSYSGNTEETISAFNEAKRKKLNTIVISSGGKLINLAKTKRVPFVKVPSGIQPRCALGYQFVALVKILSKIGIIKKIDSSFLRLEKEIEPLKIEKKAKILARRLNGYIPICYSSGNWSVLAKIWKINFNENSKVPSFFNFFPEVNHNEMVGMAETKIKDTIKLFKIIILREKNENKRNIKRIKVTSEILKNKKIGVIFVDIEGKTFLGKLFSNILLSSLTSYYLGLFQKIDPEPVKTVEEFKKKIAK